jgi:hypothetical protein
MNTHDIKDAGSIGFGHDRQLKIALKNRKAATVSFNDHPNKLVKNKNREETASSIKTEFCNPLPLNGSELHFLQHSTAVCFINGKSCQRAGYAWQQSISNQHLTTLPFSYQQPPSWQHSK